KGFTSNRTFSVDRLAEGIHYTTQHAFAYRNRSDFIGTTDGIAFSDCIGWTQCYHTYVIFFEVQNDPFQAVFKLDKLSGLNFGQSVDTGNTITHLQYGTYFFKF